MRTARSALALATVLATILAVAGCAGQSPGWTYAPAPPVTPPPSVVASGSPGASGAPASGAPASAAPGSAAPSAGASGAPQTSGGPVASGSTVTIVASNAQGFDTPQVEAPANKPWTLVFDNKDATQPHNVVIQNADGSLVSMGDTAFFTGPATKTYNVPALDAGKYPFMCQVHPTVMKGTIDVK
jgi:plastocyanin